MSASTSCRPLLSSPALPCRALLNTWRSLQPKLHAMALRRCHDSELARDLVQDVFERALRSGATGDVRISAPWLVTILKHLLIDQSRRYRIARWVPLEREVEAKASVSVCAEAEPASEAEGFSSDEIHNAMKGLPECYRQVVAQVYFEELSYRDVSRCAGIQIGTVGSRLARARARLKRALVDRHIRPERALS